MSLTAGYFGWYFDPGRLVALDRLGACANVKTAGKSDFIIGHLFTMFTLTIFFFSFRVLRRWLSYRAITTSCELGRTRFFFHLRRISAILILFYTFFVTPTGRTDVCRPTDRLWTASSSAQQIPDFRYFLCLYPPTRRSTRHAGMMFCAL